MILIGLEESKKKKKHNTLKLNVRFLYKLIDAQLVTVLRTEMAPTSEPLLRTEDAAPARSE